MKWISVKDRLPQIGEWVWIYAKSLSFSWVETSFQSSGTLVGTRDDGEVWFLAVNSTQFPVTHWMPLPEPPNE